MGVFMAWLTDLWNQITQIFTTADMITLAMIAIVVIAVGFMTESLSSIVTMTFVGLVAFAILEYVRALTGVGMPASNQDATALAQTDWHNLLTMQVQLLIAYAVAFAVLIGIVSTIRSLVFR
jgi:hypothetical protein